MHAHTHIHTNTLAITQSPRQFSTLHRTVIVSIRSGCSYRLAPEHVFPAPLNDCVKATRYFMANAERFGVDVNRIAVAGDSSGANLAAAVALRARDENWTPALKAQVLFYPPMQAINFNTPSYQRYRCTAHLDLPSLVSACLAYAFGDVTRFRLSDFARNGHVSAPALERYRTYVDVSLAHNSTRPIEPPILAANDTLWEELKDVFTDPYFAPLMARNLSRMPATFISTAEQDVLLDDGLTYAARLRQDGVDLQHRHYMTIHGTMSYMFLDAARDLVGDTADYLRGNL
ncbi:hypothetical protein NP493_3127g00000 [Ridgeia piscesae]|uniref:Alpha/beta hydrolase fold-3 domain-containing protein n=1 Tax=Ridgeia piscesae TaxID=27915 RepID=A0AAD9J999_RIDPI|nr:hypothetical protein NP493_3127g00000 [Ridgeia piscesae]